MTIKQYTKLALARTSYVATDQDIQRAYWRFAKHPWGINGKPSNTAETLAEYLISSGIAKRVQITTRTRS